METIKTYIRKHFTVGLLALLPFFLCYLVLGYIYSFFVNKIFILFPKIFTAWYLNSLVYFTVAILIIFILGIVTVKLFISRWKSPVDSVVSKVPFFSFFFHPAIQLVDIYIVKKNNMMKRVVFVEYPRKGVYAIGFITKEHIRKGNKDYVSVFIPTTPVPMSGYVVFIPRKEVIDSDLSIEEALKVVISGGVVAGNKFSMPENKKEEELKNQK